LPGAPGYADDKASLLRRLARIEGQIRGIAKMVEGDRYCIDVLTQIGAIDTALSAVGMKLLDSHVKHCVADALASGNRRKADEKSRELLDAVERFAKIT
jgi:DNA-binding FrmR family transcriptional regulator